MENFIVSARKYRPATFLSVVGQKHITSTLKNAISRNQLAHAYLFCGPRGVGKTTCARIFAKAINCSSPVENEACGECESCRSFNEGRSFSIHELDAASNNSVDDIRSLTEQVRIPPQVGKYSVYIIDEVHMLSAQAFNAFLKTLEEPPAHAIFILATTEKHKIIPTILSRCQIFDFNRIRVEESVEYLKYIAQQESVGSDDESLHLIALKADGGMRDALSMFDKAVSFCGSELQFSQVAQTLNVLDYDTYFNVTSLLLKGEYPQVLTLFDQVLCKGFSPQIFIAGLNNHLRDLLMTKSPHTLPLLEISGTLLDRYRQQGGECDAEFLFDSIALLTSIDGTLRTASNQRLNVELGLMKLSRLAQKKNPDVAAGSGEGGSEAPCTELPELKQRQASGAANNTPVQKAESAQQPPVKAEADVPARTVEERTVDKADAPPEQRTAGETETGSVSDDESVGVIGKEETKSTATNTQDSVAVTEERPEREYDAERSAAETATIAESGRGGESEKGVESATTAATGVGTGSNANGRKTPTISGTSIDSILNSSKNVNDVAITDDTSEEEVGAVDPQSEEKIKQSKEEFLNRLNRKRPRIAMAMEEMSVEGNVISFSVPTETLYEDIMRGRTEILTLLCETASVEGRVKMDISIREDNRARKPIKAEDKLRFMTEQNPNLTLLRKELNLDIE